MPLTPEDVRKKTFTPVRLREGYDMGEVDQFLDEVEAELTRLHRENDDLRAKVAGPPTDKPGTASPGPTAQPAQAPGPVQKPEPVASPAAKTVPEASSAAARLLEIATNNADQLVNEARTEADGILGSARTEAERLEGDARSKVEQMESDARTRAERLEAETATRRQQLVGELERDKESLTRELEDLRAFEREYRSRLRTYFQSQLRALDGQGDDEVVVTPAVDGDTPRRLRELLGEEQT